MAVAICMVALEAGAQISGGKIPSAWQARWPGGPLPAGAQKKANTISFQVGELLVAYGFMPAAIPWQELQPICVASILWPEAAAELQRHKQHAVVSVSGEGAPQALMTVLTQATCALIDASKGAIGVYWCSSRLVLPSTLFCETASEELPGQPPLAIWVNPRVTTNADGAAMGYTQGLAVLGHREFECVSAAEPADELFQRLFGLAQYVLTQGAVIKDGDTIGETATEKIKISYGPSSFGLPGEVMRLEYPGKAASGDKITTYGKLHAAGTLLCTIGFGVALYAWFPWLQGSFLRHILFLPMILIFGLVLLLISDRIFQKLFGWQAFDKPKGAK